MAANFSTLRPLLLTALQGVTELQIAYDIHTENTTGYPYATFEPSGHTNEMYTTNDNLREYTFDIIIYQELTKAGRDLAIENLAKAVDAVVTALDTNTTLRVTGGAHYVKALPSSWGEYVNAKGPIKYARLSLIIGVEIDVT
jgi:hypothetical protein